METVKLVYDTFHSKRKSDALPIILLHGYYWNRFVYREIGQRLADDNKCTVYSPDLRNHGESPCPEGLTMEIMAKDVRQFMNEHGLQKVNFVTHSLPSSIPYLIHWTEPDRVGKMVLLDMLPFHYQSKERNEKLAYPAVSHHRKMLKLLDPQMTLSDAKSKFYKLALASSASQKYYYMKIASDLIKENEEFKYRLDPEYLFTRYVDGYMAPKWIGPSNHDILIIRCEGSDHASDEDCEFALNYVPEMRFVTLKNTTHLLMFERQIEVLQLIKEFLMVDKNSLPAKRFI